MQSVGQYTMVAGDKALKFGNRTFRVVLYGAYNAYGLIGTENNGIAVLDEDSARVVLDGHLPQDTGSFGPSEEQVLEWNRICGLGGYEFVEFCNSHPMCREPVTLERKVRQNPKLDVERFIHIAKESVAYDPALKSEFLRTGKQMLIRMAYALGLNEDQYDLRVNKAGIAVSGEVTLHTDSHYVQFSQSRPGTFLVRSCKNRKDYTGGQNHWVKWEDLRNLDKVCEFIKGLK